MAYKLNKAGPKKWFLKEPAKKYKEIKEMKEIFKAISDELIDTQSNILPCINIDENQFSLDMAQKIYSDKIDYLKIVINKYLDSQLIGFKYLIDENK